MKQNNEFITLLISSTSTRAMIEIKQSEFEQYPVFGGPNFIKEIYGVQATSERFWFKHDDMLGIVLFDNIDGDWSMIALAKDNVGVYRGFEVACSYRTAAAAKRALRQVLEKPRLSPAEPNDDVGDI